MLLEGVKIKFWIVSPQSLNSKICIMLESAGAYFSWVQTNKIVQGVHRPCLGPKLQVISLEDFGLHVPV